MSVLNYVQKLSPSEYNKRLKNRAAGAGLANKFARLLGERYVA